MESVQRIERDEQRYKVSQRPKVPYKNTVFGDIAYIASAYGGIIVGSYALLIYNQNYKQGARDVDILTSRPYTLAKIVAEKLNEKYKNRFYVKKHINSYKIYDKQLKVSVADFINYSIKSSDYSIIDGMKVAHPAYVFRGRKRRAKTQYTGMGMRIPRIRIGRFI